MLTLSQPSHSDFGSRLSHDFRSPLTSSRLSPKLDPVRTTSRPAGFTEPMSTHHRGLPPPAGMTLQDPARPPVPPQVPTNLSHPLAALPDQPRYQTSTDQEPMRNWLATKAEEEKRRQEEERTRQQSLKLEQRRIEHAMLQDSLHGQIPPHMVPMIFAGIGGANLASFSLEVLQQWQQQMLAAQQQFQTQHPQQQHDYPPPEQRGDSRTIHQNPTGYGPPSQQQPSSTMLPSSGVLAQVAQPPPPGQHPTFSAYQSRRQPSPPARMASQGARAAAHNALPRLTTGDIQIQPPPTAAGSAHPLHQTQTIREQDQPSSSPSIYFHHWVPPTTQADRGGAPQTPLTAPSTSHASEGDFVSSPRKRKHQGNHPPTPAPSGPSYTSPAFSTSSASGRRTEVSHFRSGSKSSREGEGAGIRHTPTRRDSGAPHHHNVSQVDFVVNVAGGPPPPDQRHPSSSSSSRPGMVPRRGSVGHTSYQHHSQTAPSSPKREYR